MLKTLKLNKYARILHQRCNFLTYFKRNSSTNEDLGLIRNIGILAHIDAGKTTTTERMLFYSGTIHSLGEVHHGNTVTDYMEQERERGITITAASVSFGWDDHQFNLIDTPGHIDFTMEVEQSLAVLDGAVIILDGSAGVEAQTMTVWRQTSDYRLPRILFANKMDRKDSSLDLCVKSLKEHLDVSPLCLQLPLRKDNILVGILDVVTKEMVVWSSGSRGRKFVSRKLSEEADGATWERVMQVRRNLVDSLSELDDQLAETIIQSESLDDLDPAVLKASIRKANLNQKAYPLLCGSAFKNIGVQKLMDAIVDYLPSPLEADHFYKCFGNELCAKVFKIQHNPIKGVLTFLRLYEGEIESNKKIYNITRQQSEQTGPMYMAYADEFQPVSKITKGNIAVVSGLKLAMSGDLISRNHLVTNNAKKALTKAIIDSGRNVEKILPPAISLKVVEVTEPTEIVNNVFSLGANVPDPVFMCSVEAPSLSEQTTLDAALAELQREDPSLRVINNEETGQTVLAGMGELHLDVVKHKITDDYKLDALFGDLSISYKEMVVNESRDKYTLNQRIGSIKQYVVVELSVRPLLGPKRDEVIRLDHSQDTASNVTSIHPRFMNAIKRGVESSFINGPRAGCPVINADVVLHWFEVTKGTADSAVSAATMQCLRHLYKLGGTVLTEPIMRLRVTTTISDTSRIIGDLNKRYASDLRVQKMGRNTIIDCLTPLSRLLGYSNELAYLTSGMANFSMEFHSNREVSPELEQEVLTSIRGF